MMRPKKGKVIWMRIWKREAEMEAGAETEPERQRSCLYQKKYSNEQLQHLLEAEEALDELQGVRAYQSIHLAELSY